MASTSKHYFDFVTFNKKIKCKWNLWYDVPFFDRLSAQYMVFNGWSKVRCTLPLCRALGEDCEDVQIMWVCRLSFCRFNLKCATWSFNGAWLPGKYRHRGYYYLWFRHVGVTALCWAWSVKCPFLANFLIMHTVIMEMCYSWAKFHSPHVLILAW